MDDTRVYETGKYTFIYSTDGGETEQKGKFVVLWEKVHSAWLISRDIGINLDY